MQDVTARRKFALSYIMTVCFLIFLTGIMEINSSARLTLRGDSTPTAEYAAEEFVGLLPDDVTGAELFRSVRGIAGNFDPYLGAAIDVCVYLCGVLSDYCPG